MASATLHALPRTVKRFQEDAVWASGKFTVDNDGRVWRGMRRAENDAGEYLQVKVMVDGVRHYTGAHRLVWRAIFGPIPVGMAINHKNGCKKDNRPLNLELATYSENQKHAYRTGLADERGQRNPSAKLTDNEVAKIRNIYFAGGYTMPQLGAMFDVTFQTISRIVRGKSRARQGGPTINEDCRHSVCDRDEITGRFITKKAAS